MFSGKLGPHRRSSIQTGNQGGGKTSRFGNIEFSSGFRMVQISRRFHSRHAAEKNRSARFRSPRRRKETRRSARAGSGCFTGRARASALLVQRRKATIGAL